MTEEKEKKVTEVYNAYSNVELEKSIGIGQHGIIEFRLNAKGIKIGGPSNQNKNPNSCFNTYFYYEKHRLHLGSDT